MAKDRSRDDRRSVGSHEKMTAALGRAAGWNRGSDRDDGRPNLATNRAKGFGTGFVNFFKPGFGHVNTGTRDYYDPSTLGRVDTHAAYDAAKGIEG